MSFRIGQKVVCVADFSSTADRWHVNCPLQSAVYTIREFEERGTEPGLRVAEIVNNPRRHLNVDGLTEPAFLLVAFRPLVERKTDISIFTAMLKTQKIDV